MSTILVADDDPFNLRLLTELCEAAGYEVVACANGREVLSTVARDRPSLILLDVEMPEVDGFEVMRILKADSDLAHIPIILVTGAEELEARELGVELGAEDYVTKPYRVFEIQQRIRNVLRVSYAEGKSRENETVDPLTRAGNSQQLRITLDYEYTRASRYDHPFTCVVVRIANYDAIVQTSGRQAGEGALVQLAGGLRQAIRGIDHLFRSDVDEFTIFLPETPKDGANVVLDRIRSQAGDRSLFGAALEPQPNLEVGLASRPEDHVESGGELLTLAVDQSRAKTRPTRR
jgi:diguanylate cyclase (GGDEF)-like protein